MIKNRRLSVLSAAVLIKLEWLLQVCLQSFFTSQKEKHVQELFDCLVRLKLPKGDFAVFGSGPLIVRGIILPTNGLDIICRGSAWDTIKKIGPLQYNDAYDVAIVALNDGRVTFGNKWGSGDFDVDDLIDGAEYIEQLPFVQLRHVIDYRLQRASAKDLLHIESLKRSDYFALVGETD